MPPYYSYSCLSCTAWSLPSLRQSCFNFLNHPLKMLPKRGILVLWQKSHPLKYAAFVSFLPMPLQTHRYNQKCCYTLSWGIIKIHLKRYLHIFHRWKPVPVVRVMQIFFECWGSGADAVWLHGHSDIGMFSDPSQMFPC